MLREVRLKRMLLFEWDEAKHARNLALRGVGFDAGTTIFVGPLVEWPDDREDYGEARVRAVGICNGEVLHVVFTDRGEVRRIISVRRANRRERTAWLRRD